MGEVIFSGWGYWSYYVQDELPPEAIGKCYEVKSMVFSLNKEDLRIFNDKQNFNHVNELLPAPYNANCELENKIHIFQNGFDHPAYSLIDECQYGNIKNISDTYGLFFSIDTSKPFDLNSNESNITRHPDYDKKQDKLIKANLIDLILLSNEISEFNNMTNDEAIEDIVKKITSHCPVYSSDFRQFKLSDLEEFFTNLSYQLNASFENYSYAKMTAKELYITKSAALNFFEIPYNKWNKSSKKFTKQDNNNFDGKAIELTSTTREKMLTLIIGMAIDGYQYKHKSNRNEFTGDGRNSLTARLQLLELEVDADTIRSYLKEAIQYLPLKDQ